MQFLSSYNTIIGGLSEKWNHGSMQMQFTSPFYFVNCLITMFRKQSVFRRKYRLISLTRFRYLIRCSFESRLPQTNRIPLLFDYFSYTYLLSGFFPLKQFLMEVLRSLNSPGPIKSRLYCLVWLIDRLG